MWINCHAIRQFHAFQSPFLVLRKYHTPPPRPVDVEPEIVYFTNSRDFWERVIGTKDGGTSARVDVEGCVSLDFGFYYGSLKFYDPRK